MNPTLSPDHFNVFFASAPWVIGLLIILVAYWMVRDQVAKSVPIGQTYACANCGRRGVREHMVPETHEGAVSWYCGNCAGH